MTELWMAGTEKPHVKVIEFDYGLPYRSIVSVYESEFHVWILTEENVQGNAYLKMNEVRFKKGLKTGEKSFTSPELPPANLQNSERHFISSYAMTVPASPDAIVDRYIHENFTTITPFSLVIVDTNQLIENVPFREYIKTAPKTETIEIKVQVKQIIEVDTPSGKNRAVDEASTKEVKVKIYGLGFTSQELEEFDIELEDLAIGFS